MANDKSKKQTLSLSSVVGDTCILLSQSGLHRYSFFLGDIEWMILPPVMNGQFKLFHSDNKPVALALWAYVSDDVEKRLENGLGRMSVKDWNSGDNLWLIDIIAPYGKAEQLIEDLIKTVFADKTFKYHRTTKDGSREVIMVSPE